MTALTVTLAFVTNALDVLARPLVWMGVVDGVHIHYSPAGAAWRMDGWRDGQCVTVQLGGFEALIDLRLPSEQRGSSKAL